MVFLFDHPQTPDRRVIGGDCFRCPQSKSEGGNLLLRFHAIVDAILSNDAAWPGIARAVEFEAP